MFYSLLRGYLCNVSEFSLTLQVSFCFIIYFLYAWFMFYICLEIDNWIDWSMWFIINIVSVASRSFQTLPNKAWLKLINPRILLDVGRIIYYCMGTFMTYVARDSWQDAKSTRDPMLLVFYTTRQSIFSIITRARHYFMHNFTK